MDDEVINPDPEALRAQAQYLSDDVLAEFQARGEMAYAPAVWQILTDEFARRTAALKSGEETIAEETPMSPPTGPIMTVYTPVTQTQMTMARIILDGEAIPYVATGQALQDVIGLGRMYTGTNLITGPMRIEVAENHFARARDLLSHIED